MTTLSAFNKFTDSLQEQDQLMPVLFVGHADLELDVGLGPAAMGDEGLLARRHHEHCGCRCLAFFPASAFRRASARRRPAVNHRL